MSSEMTLEEFAALYLDSWHRHDIDDILSFHTDDTVYTSVATGREAVGLQALRETLETVFTVWPDLHFFQRRAYLNPDVVVFESTAEVTQSGPMPIGDTIIEPVGVPVRFDVADVFAIRGGRIARKDSYIDALGYLNAMRAAGAATRPSAATDGRAPTGDEGSSSPAPIPDEAQQMISYVGLAYVATTRPDGRPNLSPKGTLKVLDDHTLAFAEIASPQTLANIRHCPDVEINVMDPFRRRGWRFNGRAEILDDPRLMATLGEGLGADYPIRLAIRIHVDRTRRLTSPIYWVTDATDDDVIAIWEDKLGYTRARG